jgi:hypothetical protein
MTLLSNETVILREIADLVFQQWETTHQPLLLSQIPPRLSKEAKELYREHFSAFGMKEFISNNVLRIKCKLVQDPCVDARIGLVPIDAEYSYPDKSMMHLKKFLESLTDTERERVSIPGSVVFKLFSSELK